MTEPTAQQIVAGIADSLVDVCVRGHLLNGDNRRVALVVEKGSVEYHVEITTADAEWKWEQGLNVEDAVRLILHKLGHHTDMIQMVGMSGAQTHALLHNVADAVGAISPNHHHGG